MMCVLLIRMNGIMQSWGSGSRFLVRGTNREPSKSGVIGAVCSALGRTREDDITDLATLKMGVRTDFPGFIRRDYQTSLGERGFIRQADESRRSEAVVSERYYLNEADFLVGLEGKEALLNQVEDAVQSPFWHAFLGRKSYVPLVPMWIPGGLVAGDLLGALKQHPWPGLFTRIPGRQPTSLKLTIESKDGAEIRRDQPVSFDDRVFRERRVDTFFLKVGDDVPLRKGS